MILEIAYSLKLDKDSPTQNSWTYYHTDTEDFNIAMKEASKYFKKFIKDNGWTRKTKLTHIMKIRNK